MLLTLTMLGALRSRRVPRRGIPKPLCPCELLKPGAGGGGMADSLEGPVMAGSILLLNFISDIDGSV